MKTLVFVLIHLLLLGFYFFLLVKHKKYAMTILEGTKYQPNVNLVMNIVTYLGCLLFLMIFFFSDLKVARMFIVFVGIIDVFYTIFVLYFKKMYRECLQTREELRKMEEERKEFEQELQKELERKMKNPIFTN